MSINGDGTIHTHGDDTVHTHAHTHADGTTHSHTHCHSDAECSDHTHTHGDGTVHAHVHTHADGTTHSHSHSTAGSPEEALALLTYMLSHNRHHADELHDIAHYYDSVEGDLLHDAVDKLNESNDLLEQALSLINNR